MVLAKISISKLIQLNDTAQTRSNADISRNNTDAFKLQLHCIYVTIAVHLGQNHPGKNKGGRTLITSKHSFYFSTLFTVALFSSTMSADAQELNTHHTLSEYVNPLIGTERSKTGRANTLTDSGLTQPGPAVPFGMISWGPNTLSNHDEQIKDKYERDVGYNYESHRIEGFALTHLSGAGCPNGGELPLLPFIGDSPTQSVTFKHEHESAAAGYYQVTLDNGVQIELTTKERTGFGRFLFKNLEKGQKYGLQFAHAKRANPLSKGQKTQPSAIHFTDDRHFTGVVNGGNFCQSVNEYRLYFAAELSESGGAVYSDNKLGRVTFKAQEKGAAPLELKIAISYVSEAGALQNLKTESNDRGTEETFNSVRQKAALSWDEALGTIQIESKSEQEKRTFYTALYNTLLHPNVQDDVTGQYRGYDNKIHTLNPGQRHYANFSGWDVYRSEIQLLSILMPKRASDMAQSLVSAADECGALPNWALNNADTAVMIGDSGPIMLADFYAFGADHFDLEKAFYYMHKNATDPKSSCNGHLSRPGLKAYLKKGYLSPDSVDFGFTSTVMEYSMSDFAISRFAHALSRESEASYFIKQSDSWKNLWWKSTDTLSQGFIRSKNDEGEWRKPFFPDHNPEMRDPEDPSSFYDQGFVEGTSAQYSLMIPFNFGELLEKMGTPEQNSKRLKQFFSDVTGGMNAPTMHIGNEPSFSTPWIYLWAGNPAGTQEVVSRIIQTAFDDSPGGLPGNDDLGETSSWYVFATLGLYPVIPGEGGLAIHNPHFPKSTIHLENGKTILIQSEGTGPYITSLSFNGKQITHTWLSWSDLKDGAVLNYQLDTQAGNWGSNKADAPPSFHP